MAAFFALTLSVLAGTEDAATARSEGDLGLPGLSVAGSAPSPAAAPDGELALAGAVAATAALPQHPGGSLGNLFNRPGIVGGFAAGFLGAGIFGLVFGHGMIAEVTNTAACLGLVFQIALMAMLLRVIWAWWRPNESAMIAPLSPRQLADAYGSSRDTSLPELDQNESSERDLGETDRR